jgi:predicted phosphodiesterase
VAFPNAAAIVFGHTHRPLNQKVSGKLLFNPGSPHCPDKKDIAPSVGLLHIHAGGEVDGEIVPLSL